MEKFASNAWTSQTPPSTGNTTTGNGGETTDPPDNPDHGPSDCGQECKSSEDCCSNNMFCCPNWKLCMDKSTYSTAGPNCGTCKETDTTAPNTPELPV